MTHNNALKSGGSLLERAAEIYDFGSGLRIAPAAVPPAPLAPASADEPAAGVTQPTMEKTSAAPASKPAATKGPAPGGRCGEVDREALREAGYILPGAPVTGLAEEFRIIKRQLLLGVSGDHIAQDKRRTILICSSQPDEGKTFSAVNLALSLATEKDLDVLLVDGDVNNPEVLTTLGLETGPGLIDAIADPGADGDAFVIDRKRGGEGKSGSVRVDLGGGRVSKK